LTEFWDIETPRTTMIRIASYRRRRGWLAWNTAVLGRFTFEDYEMGIPPLEQTMGLPPRNSRVQSAEELSAIMRAWVGATGSRSIN
jgi:hypothetical protein